MITLLFLYVFAAHCKLLYKCVCVTEAESEGDCDAVESLLIRQFIVSKQSTRAAAQLTAARRTIQHAQTDTTDQEIPQVIEYHLGTK